MGYHKELLDIIEKQYNDSLNNINDINIKEYLEVTKNINLPSSERLRQLAIYMEENYMDDTPYKGWQIIKSIYGYASDRDPNNEDVYHSFGITASHYAVLEDNELLRDELFAEAKAGLIKANQIKPNDADILYSLGMNDYSNYKKSNSEAMDWFIQALKKDPHHYMAQMYIGHCYFDNKEWQNALEAFQKVDSEKLAANWPQWRKYKLNELIGCCYAQLGNYKEGIRMCADNLLLYEKAEKEGWYEELPDPDELVNVICTIYRKELFARLIICLERLNLLNAYSKYL
jgi:tetratricopeptide (TPR) repeat protein